MARIRLLALALAAALHAAPPDRVVPFPVASTALQATVTAQVLLPPDYDREPRSYPVLYLLHGFTDHSDAWLKLSRLADHAGALPLVIVLPEGGNGWYVDGVLPRSAWEAHFRGELLPAVEARFRIDPSRRAIAGLSMGGFGALRLALGRPGDFAVAASLSGAVAAPDWTVAEMRRRAFDPDLQRSVLDAFGPEGAPAHRRNSLATLLAALPPRAPLPFLYLDCGTEDELGFLEDNRALARALQTRGIPHEFRELPGRHEWSLWDRQIQEVLRLLESRWHLSRRP